MSKEIKEKEVQRDNRIVIRVSDIELKQLERAAESDMRTLTNFVFRYAMVRARKTCVCLDNHLNTKKQAERLVEKRKNEI